MKYLGLTAAVMFASSAAAQTPPAGAAPAAPPSPSSSSADATATSSTASLGDIVVTAQRRSERLQDVPLTVTALSGDQMAKAGVTSLRDIQSVVSGFTFSGLGTLAQPSIRGVTTFLTGPGTENPNALYVDGIYQATQVALNNELPDLERIEILKGPQGTLFGRNAVGGAIQIFTRQPTFTPTADITAESGFYPKEGTSHSSPREDLRAFLSTPVVPDLLAASVSGGYSYTQGYEYNDANGDRTGKIAKFNARTKLLFTPASNVDLTISAFYVSNRDEADGLGTPTNGLSAASAYPGSIVPTEPYHVAFDGPPPQINSNLTQFGFIGRLRIKLDAGTITSLTGYTDSRVFNQNSIHNALGSFSCQINFACIDYYFKDNSKEFSQELNFSSRDFGLLNFVGGLFYYNNKGYEFSQLQLPLAAIIPSAFPLVVTVADTHTTSYAAYGEIDFKPLRGLTIIAGLRENHEPHNDISYVPPSPDQQKTFNSTTPRVSIKYDLTSHLNAYATFSIGYKSGSTGILNQQTVPQFLPVAPEKLYAYETGLKYASHDLTVDGAFYYYDYLNKQEQTFTGLSTIVENTGPVRIFGFDMDASARLADTLTLSAAASWMPVAKYLDFKDASAYVPTRVPFDTSLPPFNCAPGGGCGGFVRESFDASGTRLARAPKVTANATLSYNNRTFDASATLNYSSAVNHDITGTIRQTAYAALNVQSGYKITEKIRLGVFCHNCTNKAYIEAGSVSASGFVAVYEAPRELGLSLAFRY